MNLFAEGEGNTPLSAEERADLIPDLATKEELNDGNDRIFLRHTPGHSRPTISAGMIRSSSLM